jgi:hypothetical protein
MGMVGVAVGLGRGEKRVLGLMMLSLDTTVCFVTEFKQTA